MAFKRLYSKRRHAGRAHDLRLAGGSPACRSDGKHRRSRRRRRCATAPADHGSNARPRLKSAGRPLWTLATIQPPALYPRSSVLSGLGRRPALLRCGDPTAPLRASKSTWTCSRTHEVNVRGSRLLELQPQAAGHAAGEGQPRELVQQRGAQETRSGRRQACHAFPQPHLGIRRPAPSSRRENGGRPSRRHGAMPESCGRVAPGPPQSPGGGASCGRDPEPRAGGCNAPSAAGADATRHPSDLPAPGVRREP